MLTYTVKYLLKGRIFKKTIKNVTGDWPDQDNKRVFYDKDENRFEVPSEGTIFELSGTRVRVIEKNMSKESGQSIKVGG